MCFHILINLAEDFEMEKKMIKKKMILHLTRTLEREDEDLLILAVTFLKKLSIFNENKNEMVYFLKIINTKLERVTSHGKSDKTYTAQK